MIVEAEIFIPNEFKYEWNVDAKEEYFMHDDMRFA